MCLSAAATLSFDPMAGLVGSSFVSGSGHQRIGLPSSCAVVSSFCISPGKVRVGAVPVATALAHSSSGVRDGCATDRSGVWHFFSHAAKMRQPCTRASSSPKKFRSPAATHSCRTAGPHGFKRFLYLLSFRLGALVADRFRGRVGCAAVRCSVRVVGL